MTAYDIIMKKRRGGELSEDEIRFMTEGFVKDDIPDYQMSALLMAICFNGMTPSETAALTSAMVNSGDTYSPSAELGRICVDKHSTGGIGDKLTLIAAPICAACGVYIPKMSGRGLGHTGGTIDKLESIPGLKTSLTHSEFISVVKEAGFAVSGQTGTLVPADKKIYALRNATATVDSIPLICSSIMSKKLATGAEGIVIDVKVGDGAFMKNYDDALRLADSMIKVAKLSGRKCSAVLTDMEKPLGMAVGNAVEVIEAAEALKGNAPADLYELSIAISAEMLSLAGKGSPDECTELAKEALSSGRALAALEKMVSLQGGNPEALHDYSLLGVPSDVREVVSETDGYITGISCEKTGLIALSLGAGRQFKNGDIDPTAGIIFNKTVGSYVHKGEVLGKLLTSSKRDMDAAERDFRKLFRISDTSPEKRPAVLKIIRS
ncbi:MAG: thymidine phosphorylase [Oscillospiraceae bacterium]|nr:thymidine phosphorylase [Oscillospiraceae bacterium]